MHWKFSANTGFFGAQRNRFVQFQPDRTLEEVFAQVAQVDGMTGIELKYPAAFGDTRLVREMLDKHELTLAAINVDTKDAKHFRHGALSAQSSAARQEAIGRLRSAMDLAAEFGTDIVTTCPLADGYDYPFQLDHSTVWGHFIESTAAVASYRPDIKFCLEYQPHEPHSHILLSNVGKMLYVCAEVSLPNLGANFDIGHAFAAQENPAESAALLARANRLFYIHTNDNTGDGGDWDMISGTVHFWHWLEVLYTLIQLGYDGWLGGDITPKHVPGPVEVYQTNLRMIQRMTQLLERVGMDKITDMIRQDGHIAETFETLSAALLPELDPQPRP